MITAANKKPEMTLMAHNSSSESSGIDLSIIVVSWNTRELTAQCLRSVLDNLSDGAFSYEIIVVDNASSDGSAQMVKDDFRSVRLICNDENLGFVGANNQASSVAKGSYCLLLNSDTLILDDTMSSIIKYLDDHPEVGIATGKVLNPDRTFQAPYQRFPGIIDSVLSHTINNIKTFALLKRRWKYGNLDQNGIHYVDSVTGAYLFIRSNLINTDKIFDDDIFMYYEDTLLCYRIRKQGYQIVYLPLAPIIHYHGMSAKQVRPDALFNSFKGSKIFIKKVYGENTANYYAKVVIIIWRIFFLLFSALRVVPSAKIKRKATLFGSLVAKSC